MRQHDQQFFDSFMLVIGILMGVAVGLFFLVRAISIDTQGLVIRADPTVQAAIDDRIKPVGDVAAWAPRIGQGTDTLYMHALAGFQGEKGFMPPKGGRVDLSDDEIRAAVDYLIEQSR